MLNLAFVLHRHLDRSAEAANLIRSSTNLLDGAGLTIDAGGQTIQQRQDFLSEIEQQP